MTSEIVVHRRTFLFLQGPSSLIFARIADNLERTGHRCLRINICSGDWIFWRRRGGFNFRGSLRDWPAYISAFIACEGVTDLILLGEERPHHLAAIAAARSANVSVFAIDMGYIRPDWIRIERDGSGFHSHFPVDPAHILRAGAALPQPDLVQRYRHTFFADASLDLVFNLSNVFLWFFYPYYRWHAIYHPLAEYWGWLRRLVAGRRRNTHARKIVETLLARPDPFFIFPLQLETDYQIRSYSPFASQRDALALVVTSFAKHAPASARLLFKLHPLDNGLVDWGGFLDTQAKTHGLQGRILFIDGARLSDLIPSTQGVITINSTVGIEAIQNGKPVKTMGVAIYDVEGVTSQMPLDEFWRDAVPPDPELADALNRLLTATLHVRGNFYSLAGVAAGAQAIAQRLDENSVNEPGGYVKVAPRSRPAKVKALVR